MEVILNVEPQGYSDEARELWQEQGSYHEGDLSEPERCPAETTVLIVRLGRRIDADVLARFPQLHTLVTATTGLDHVDLAELERRGIRLLCLRDSQEFLASIPSTAEHTLALMLALMRRLPQAAQSVADGQWNRDAFRGRQLKGRRLGLLGLGRVGSMVAHYAHAFGMQVGYHDPQVSSDSWQRFDSLEALAAWSEMLSIHVHLAPDTRGLVDAAVLARMPRGGWLVNTSRAGIVDEAAVAAALRSGQLAGVATDVLSDELVAEPSSPLRALLTEQENIIITPHIGGATIDAMHACEVHMVRKFCVLGSRP